jgi:tetratricopeptide (TPR) repeat protein
VLPQAEAYYKKSLELETDDENANNNYASFLMNIRKDYDQAKKHYKKSLESKPNNATFNGNYANLLKGIRKNYDQAEKHYKKAHHQVQVLRIFCNTLLLGRDFCEYSLKRMRN